MDYKIEEALDSDVDGIYGIWKKNSNELGIIFKPSVVEFVINEKALVIRDGGRIIAFTLYSTLSTKPIVRVEGIYVDPEYRGKGLSIMMFYEVIQREKYYIIYGYDLYVEAYDGLENNTLYDKLSDGKYELKEKDRLMRVYKLDTQKIADMYILKFRVS